MEPKSSIWHKKASAVQYEQNRNIGLTMTEPQSNDKFHINSDSSLHVRLNIS